VPGVSSLAQVSSVAVVVPLAHPDPAVGERDQWYVIVPVPPPEAGQLHAMVASEVA
jgi:hypothetical protein